MKKLVSTLIFFLVTVVCLAQNKGINYKAKIADNSGNALDMQSVTVQFTILEGNTGSNEVYRETHATTTDANGIIIVNIGEGTVMSGNYNTINWGFDTHFLKTEIDTGSGYVEIGNTEFKAVPYALYAENSGNANSSSPFEEATVNVISASNTNADFLVGSTSTEDQNNVNLDARMFFDKGKAAFRAGASDGSQWNDANRGLYSFAGGRNTTADGIASTAFGENNEASGYGSTTLGRQNVANGSNSLVAGFGNISSNMINAQTVLGKWNEVDNDALLIIGNGADDLTRKNIFSVKNNGNIIADDLTLAEITNPQALVTKAYVDANLGTPSTGLEALDEGNGNGWRLIGQDANNYGNIGLGAVDLSTSNLSSNGRGAIGNYAFASGLYTLANGNYSFAHGNGSIAQSDYSFAFGSASTAIGENSVAIGEIADAEADFSFAFGFNSVASGSYSFSFGNNIVASGNNSFAAGDTSSATGEGSIAIGLDVSASGSYSAAFGWDTVASGQSSIAFGYDTEASAYTSTAFGLKTIASGQSSMAVGKYNIDDPSAIFSVGNGGFISGRNTAFKVMATGEVNINNLSGIGTRNVSVDAQGNLIANSTLDEDVLVITPFDFVKEIDNNGLDFTRNNLQGAYIGAPGDLTRIYAPVHLPKNATITKVDYVYKDTETQSNVALEFAIGFQEFNSLSNSSPIGGFVSNTILNTNNFPQTNGVAIADNVNFQLSSVADNLYRAYYVRVAPLSAGWSGTSDTAILQVRIHYTY